jgi:probable DNA metabolism protein
MPVRVSLRHLNDFAEWRLAARGLLLEAIPPEDVTWLDPAEPEDLLDRRETFVPPLVERPAGRVPRRFLRQGQAAICHNDPARFALLYALLWRLQKDRDVMFNLADTDVGKLNRRVDAVVAEYKRMKDDLRFRLHVAADGHKGLAAWFSPKHYVLERVAPHFTRSHSKEDWMIETPYRTAFWDRRELKYAESRKRGSWRA